jgi:hypothetical protein
VASQALLMMNNEFVAEQARAWGRRMQKAEAGPQQRIERMFLTAFGRPAEENEIGEVLGFLTEQRMRYASGDSEDPRLWGDLAHVLFNSTEFIFVR